MDWQEFFFKNDELGLHQWILEQKLEIESIKENLEEEQRQLQQSQRKLEQDRKKISQEAEHIKREIQLQKESENRRLKQENQLFDLKWKLLEEEVRKLADEKKRMEKIKKFYQKVQEQDASDALKKETKDEHIIAGDRFFVGVKNELALKKRYRDLIKIYHPDNISGDTDTIKEIAKEYDKLKQHLGK